MPRDYNLAKIGLPLRPFLYTLEQVADFFSMTEKTLKTSYCWFEGIHVGVPEKRLLRVRDIHPDRPDQHAWRVAEKELIRWLRYTGFRVYDRNTVEN